MADQNLSDPPTSNTVTAADRRRPGRIANANPHLVELLREPHGSAPESALTTADAGLERESAPTAAEPALTAELAPATVEPALEVAEPDDNPVAAARGIALGALIGLSLWTIAGLGIWLIF